MERVSKTVVAASVLLLGLFFTTTGWSQTSGGGGVDRLYILDCGLGHGNDLGYSFTNEVDEGKPHDDPVHCYLIHHAQGYFLFDTGISDFVASMSGGWQAGDAARGVHWTRAKTVLSQLSEIGVKPSDIHMIGISHTHPDHMGNIEEFPNAVLYIQKAEYDDAFSPGHVLSQPPQQPWVSFRQDHPVKLLEGDTDVFGDGSVMLIYTPGHTPGHQSCLVHLPQTGWVILSGDAVHKQTNWDNDRIPHFEGMSDINKLRTLTSMQRIRNLMEFYHAQLWINHADVDPTKKQKYAPEYYQ
jgi:glyoxylase-like metal-dependent hydrolase (beta-lactamase superfamily II)